MTRGRADPEVLRRHLAALRQALRHLAPYAGRGAAELRSDTALRWAIERGLQLSAQNVLDIATHLAAASGVDAPDYASAIEGLATLGVVSPEFAARLRPLAGFRNVLVHGYLELDLAIVERVLKEELATLESFAAQVEAYLAAAR